MIKHSKGRDFDSGAGSGHQNGMNAPLSCESKEGDFCLSGRQKQMLDAIVEGKQYKEIAFEYGISVNTVAFHISKLKERLGCASSREIITAAILKGLVSIDSVG